MRGLLLLLSGILAVLVVAEWRYWPTRSPILTKPAPAVSVSEREGKEQKETTRDFQLPPLEDFEEVSRRPLFYEGRRPPELEAVSEQDAAPEEVKVAKPDFSLKAILIIDAERYALVQAAADKDSTTRLRMGDEYAGWVVREIRADRLVLGQGKTREEFLLRQYEKVPLPLPKIRTKRQKKRTIIKKPPTARRPARKRS